LEQALPRRSPRTRHRRSAGRVAGRGGVRRDERMPDRARARCCRIGQGVPHDRGRARRRARRGTRLLSAPVYLLSGSDPVLRGEALERLVAELIGDDDRSLAVEEFAVPGRAAPGEGETDAPSGAQGREEVVAAALNAAQSPPFMTGRRVVVLHEAGNLGSGDVAPLIAYLDRPLDTTALVVVAGGGRLPRSFADALKAAKAVQVGPEVERTHDVLAPPRAAAGIELRSAAAKLVTSHPGEDAGRGPQLVELLASAAGPGATLDVADVEPYLGDAGPVPNYQLTGAIEAGGMGGAPPTPRRRPPPPRPGPAAPAPP